MISVQEMVLGGSSRVRHVIRYSNCFRMKNETVAEHLFFVTWYALLIARDLKWSERQLAEVLQKALLHDLEEAESGDFPRTFKYSSPSLKAALDAAGEKAFRLVLQDTVEVNELEALRQLWSRAKEGETGKLVAFADYLAIVAYLAQEVKVANFTLREHCRTIQEYSAKFDEPEFDFIRKYVLQAKALLREVQR